VEVEKDPRYYAERIDRLRKVYDRSDRRRDRFLAAVAVALVVILVGSYRIAGLKAGPIDWAIFWTAGVLFVVMGGLLGREWAACANIANEIGWMWHECGRKGLQFRGEVERLLNAAEGSPSGAQFGC
jgi:hypothetical protein